MPFFKCKRQCIYTWKENHTNWDYSQARLHRHVSMEMRHIRSERTQKLKELKPNPDRREKTGGFLTQIAKFAIDSTINYSLKFKALAG